ncbi:universal stress protein [Accumulibacter sp.]|uniref:universal stress protein n=1 Tax=Accumulibacter sp. TaxID=2053492 RepID=UPI0025EA9CAF|nr:universal stress protein [Accumulibacter sp.]MCM8596084.1 universal stress protein [Accumulibacter sp.]MCM8627015.1 universal stress protein [Accumulibacter sp.]MDS4050233.1 universal stress protein [Accumulibacter sp.]
MYRHILVPSDGSELSMAAARAAVALARDTGARITAFHVKPPYPESFYDDGAPSGPAKPERFAGLVDRHAKRILDSVLDLCRKAGVPADSRTATSDAPYQAIIDAANKAGCDLIFMASHGRSGVKALFLGSETYKVLSSSKIPVLVYR